MIEALGFLVLQLLTIMLKKTHVSDIAIILIFNFTFLQDIKVNFLITQELFGIVNSYRDFSFNERTYENGEQIRLIYTLHALNHSLKTRTKIINNNAR